MSIESVFAAIVAAAAALVLARLLGLLLYVWELADRRRNRHRYDADRAEARILLADAHTTALQLGDLLAASRQRYDELRVLVDVLEAAVKDLDGHPLAEHRAAPTRAMPVLPPRQEPRPVPLPRGGAPAAY